MNPDTVGSESFIQLCEALKERGNAQQVLVGFIKDSSHRVNLVNGTFECVVSESALESPRDLAQALCASVHQQGVPLALVLHKESLAERVLEVASLLISTEHGKQLTQLILNKALLTIPKVKTWTDAAKAVGVEVRIY